MPDDERREHWRLEKKGVEYIIQRKGIKPGDFIWCPTRADSSAKTGMPLLYLYRTPLGGAEGGGGCHDRKLHVERIEGFLMFVGVSTWTHPDKPEWRGIPCINVLADVVYMIGRPGMAIRKVAKSIQKFDHV